MTFDFDPNRPPEMPVSALLYMPTWMRLMRQHAPWFIYPIARHHRRDALRVAHWLRFYIYQYVAALWWAEMNPQPLLVFSRVDDKSAR